MDWHRRVPRDRLENLRFRLELGKACARDKRLRREVLEACRTDILFWVNAFVFVFEPRQRRTFPCATWPFQDDAILAIVEAIREGAKLRPAYKDMVIEKSRDMTASWSSLIVMDHEFLFEPQSAFLIVSRKKELVDKPGDPDCLLWKIDFIHQHLPAWMLPEIERADLHFGNLDNGSMMDGDTTTGAAGVGGRRTAMFIDEFSRIKEGYELLAGTADTTNCRIFNFTPFGTAGAAYQLAKRDDIRKLRLHWTLHPEKAAGLYTFDEQGNVVYLDKMYRHDPDYDFHRADRWTKSKLRSPWYDDECLRRKNQIEVAMMLDIDYQGSSYQYFSTELIDDLSAEYALPPLTTGELDYLPDTFAFERFLPAADGSVKLWLTLDAKGRPPFDRTYVFGADVAAGTGASNSCLSGIDCKTGEKVVEMVSPHVSPEEFAARTLALLHWFTPPGGKSPKLIWEMEGTGTQFGKAITQAGYANVYLRRNELTYSKKSTDTPGWAPTPINKLVVLSVYRKALIDRAVINRSAWALEECKQFVYTHTGKIVHSDTQDDQDPTGAQQNHGDRVIADALATKLYLESGQAAAESDQKDVAEVPPNSLAARRAAVEARRREETAELWD